MKTKMTGFETGVYYLMCFLTLGGMWVYKVVVKKALSEQE